MNLFDLLQLSASAPIAPASGKIHLAVSNGIENPLDVYFQGKFDDWQRWQSKRNFGREYVISLISLGSTDQWLFVGVYRTDGYAEEKHDKGTDYIYNTTFLDEFSELAGRLVVTFKRTGRASYLRAENWADQITVHELRAEKMRIMDFPGFNKTRIKKFELDIIVRQALPSWKSALYNVAGIYLITDTKTGKLYVGSACGEGGIWARWCSYAENGHGGNVELRQLLADKGEDYVEHFQYTVLEIADTHAGKEDVLKREGYWKEVFLSRTFGYNKN